MCSSILLHTAWLTRLWLWAFLLHLLLLDHWHAWHMKQWWQGLALQS